MSDDVDIVKQTLISENADLPRKEIKSFSIAESLVLMKKPKLSVSVSRKMVNRNNEKTN